VRLVLILALSIASFGCKAAANANLSKQGLVAAENVPVYRYEVVNAFPHDPDAFTQGLVFHDGKLFESTGKEGKSSVRQVELETGKVLRKVDLDSRFFGEGLTLLQGKLYQLTWEDQLGFIYDARTFEKLGEFNYEGEGWGLTDDGAQLIMSDGSSQIRFLDPTKFHLTKTIAVSYQNRPVNEINELEYINGEIYANIWHKNQIARISPQTGQVIGWIDLSGLMPSNEIHDEQAVLNGIAYDSGTGRLFVTGKLWPRLFEIRLKQ
jgi:glutamine cyclotransferase